jgi:hypothetical protein
VARAVVDGDCRSDDNRGVPEVSLSLLPLAALAGVAVCGGCGLLLGVSDYAVQPDEPDAGEPLAPFPALPADPDPIHGRCGACAAAQCQAERDRCIEDPACARMLRCHGSCTDPDCMAQCRDAHDAPLLFSDYFLCVFGSEKEGGPPHGCVVQCGGGNNWGCLGEYVWRTLDTSRVVAEVSILAANAGNWNPPLNGVAGADVAWCPQPSAVAPRPPEDECGGWTTTDAYGRAALRSAGGFDVLAFRSRFVGAQDQLYIRPVRRSGSLDVAIEPKAGLRQTVSPTLAQQTGTPIDQALGIVTVLQTDCFGQLAPARIALERAEGDAVGCPYEGNTCNTALDAGTRWAFFNVPRRRTIDVVARPREDDREIARRRIFLYDGWDAQVMLYPRPFQ